MLLDASAAAGGMLLLAFCMRFPVREYAGWAHGSWVMGDGSGWMNTVYLMAKWWEAWSCMGIDMGIDMGMGMTGAHKV